MKILQIIIISTILHMPVFAEVNKITFIKDIKPYSNLLLINGTNETEAKYIKKERHLYIYNIHINSYKTLYNLKEIKDFISYKYNGGTISIYSNNDMVLSKSLAIYLDKKYPKINFDYLIPNFE